jgi:hypothetical protein
MADGYVNEPMMQPQPSPMQHQTERTRDSVVAFLPVTDVEIDRPTVTEAIPSVGESTDGRRPKIVVFGASGKIGRRVLGGLLSSGEDIDVVAYVRDRERLVNAMYDDVDIVIGNLVNGGKRGGEKGNMGNDSVGPRLRIVVGDAVSRRDVCRTKNIEGRNAGGEDSSTLLRRWWSTLTRRRRADHDDGNAIDRDVGCEDAFDDRDDDDDDALSDAITGASVLISCLGTNRATNFWTDYLRVPLLRTLRGKEVGRWCKDPKHPYYVNYLSTKRILEGAEKEQRRRDAILEFEREKEMLEGRLKRGRDRARGMKEDDDGEEEEGFEDEIASVLRKKRNHVVRADRRRRRDDHHRANNARDAVALPMDGELPSPTDRVKFIRISHLMVGRSPFRIRHCLTNALWSQVSRYEVMGEMLMEESALVDTIVLRPGDVTDEERNRNNTSLQLCIDGTVPSPSLIGRDDVADLAIVAALTRTSSRRRAIRAASDLGSIISDDAEAPPNRPAHHWTWAMRWTGQHLIPPQGLRPDGFADAATCFVGAVKEQAALDRKRRSREKYLESYHGGREVMRLIRWRRRIKPFIRGMAVSIPVYLIMGMFSWYLFGQTFVDLFSRLKRLNTLKL